MRNLAFTCQRQFLAAALYVSVINARAADDGLASTPLMGWNSWNAFRCDVNEHGLFKVDVPPHGAVMLKIVGMAFRN